MKAELILNNVKNVITATRHTKARGTKLRVQIIKDRNYLTKAVNNNLPINEKILRAIIGRISRLDKRMSNGKKEG